MTTESAPRDTSASRNNLTAYLIIILALVGAMVAVSTGITDPAVAGRLLVHQLLALLVAVAVLGLVLRGHSARAKSYGRLTVGVVLLVWSATVVLSEWRDIQRVTDAKKDLIESLLKAGVAPPLPSATTPLPQPEAKSPAADTTTADEKVAYLNGAKSLMTRLATESVALDKRFEDASASFEGLLEPANLTDRQAIKDWRAKIRQFAVLTDERDKALERDLSTARAYIASADLSDSLRQRELDDFDWSQENVRHAMAKIGRAQRDVMQAASEMLDFAEQNLGNMRIVGGFLQFQTDAQQARYEALTAKLQESAARKEDASNDWLELQQAGIKARVDEYPTR